MGLAAKHRVDGAVNDFERVSRLIDDLPAGVQDTLNLTRGAPSIIIDPCSQQNSKKDKKRLAKAQSLLRLFSAKSATLDAAERESESVSSSSSSASPSFSSASYSSASASSSSASS